MTKAHDINNLLGGRIYSGSWFKSFQFKVSWLHCFEAENHGEKMLISQPGGSQNAEGERERERKGREISF